MDSLQKPTARYEHIHPAAGIPAPPSGQPSYHQRIFPRKRQNPDSPSAPRHSLRIYK